MLSGNLLWDEKYTHDMLLVKHRERYELSYPNLPANMHEVLSATAAKFPNKIAIIDEFDQETTFEQLREKTDLFAAMLAENFGVGKGMRVGILLYNSLEFCVAFYALCKLGAVTVPIPTKFKREEIEALMEKARLDILIHDNEFDAIVEDALTSLGAGAISIPFAQGVYGFAPGAYVGRMGKKRRSPSLRASQRRNVHARAAAKGGLADDCILMFTSGTTSESKGVVLSNMNLMHSIITYHRLLDLTPDDVSIIPMPMYHITGLAALLSLFTLVGGTLYLHKKFEARRVLDEVRARGITLIHASPTIFIKILAEKDNCPSLPSLRQLACGSSNMPIKYLRELKTWLPNISFRTIYGLTETSSPASVFPGDAASSPYIGSSGWPVPGLMMKVVDDAGRELPNGQVGELLIRGAVVMEEYDGRTDGFTEDRWFKSGDLARLTDDGYVYITDRKKDMINRGGEKVWSYEIENLLHDCPDVLEAAVVGMPDDVYGEIVAALIRPRPGSGSTPQGILDQLSGRVAKYKLPSLIHMTDDIPRTPNGKVDKIAIRRLLTTVRMARSE